MESEIRLDTIPERDWLPKLIELERGGPRLLTLVCSPTHLERAKQALLGLRAEGVPAMLVLDAKNTLLQDEELGRLFEFLNDWDQLTLRNILELCLDWIPREFHTPLQTEARTEFKWVQEWQLAANDPRVHKYPGLPWRSFLRRINHENYVFSTEFLMLIALPSTPENKDALETHLKRFLHEKKKAVCIYPRRKTAPAPSQEEKK